jgi:hypothetical protein
MNRRPRGLRERFGLSRIICGRRENCQMMLAWLDLGMLCGATGMLIFVRDRVRSASVPLTTGRQIFIWVSHTAIAAYCFWAPWGLFNLLKYPIVDAVGMTTVGIGFLWSVAIIRRRWATSPGRPTLS